ncbi:MAG: ribonuclease III [Pseudomonadota bacterium]
MQARSTALERRLGYRFRDPALLEQALTHRSFGSPHNERLEFLGDAVLGCVIASELYTRFAALPEGELHERRMALVRQTTLAAVARSLELSDFVRVGVGEETRRLPSVLADGLEAVYGAVLLDGGYEAARKAILRTFGDELERLAAAEPPKNAKSRLQEKLHARGLPPPRYQVLATTGRAHQPVFEVECAVERLGLRARASGGSRRAAEQQAAAELLAQLER